MKTDIRTRKSETTELVWYTCTETCDACGRIINYAGDVETTKEVDVSERDFCVHCLNFALKNKIPKEKLIEEVKNKKNIDWISKETTKDGTTYMIASAKDWFNLNGETSSIHQSINEYHVLVEAIAEKTSVIAICKLFSDAYKLMEKHMKKG